MKTNKLLAVLLCVALLAGIMPTAIAAAETAGIVVTANKTEVVPGDIVTYTVFLKNASKVEGGIWNYEYYLDIPEGLTLLEATVEDTTEFLNGVFNTEAKMGTSMGRFGSGYTGDTLVLASFTCKVEARAQGALTVSTFDVVFTDQNYSTVNGETGSATVTAPAIATGTPGILVDADKTEVAPGDIITYTVSLIDADLVDGGVWNYEYCLDIPEGLTLLECNVLDKTFAGATFNESAMVGTALGLIGAGYTGDTLLLASFTCQVNENVAGKLTVATFDVFLTDKNCNTICGETGSATVTSTIAATGMAGIVVSADKTDVVPSDIVTYTVTLIDADQMSGGVWNYEYYLDIPEGLTLLEGRVQDTVFMGATFNKDAQMGTSMGRFGSGYTGKELVLITFTCQVDENVAGELTVSTFGVIITDSNGTALDGADSSTTVHSHICDPKTVAEVPATCTTEGVKAHGKCACGRLYMDGRQVTEADLVIPMKDHEMGAFVLTLAPTCTEAGEETATCANCDHTQTREVTAKGHTEVVVAGKEVTCTEPGLTEGKKCAVCGETTVAQEEIPAKGHSYVEGSCTDCGEKDPDYAGKRALLGDINLDGQINSADVSLLFRYVSKDGFLKPFTAEQLTVADVNGDGQVNSADMSILYRYVAKDKKLAWVPEEILIPVP